MNYKYKYLNSRSNNNTSKDSISISEPNYITKDPSEEKSLLPSKNKDTTLNVDPDCM